MKFTLSSMITSDAENDLLAFGLFKSKAEKKKSNAKEKATCQFESSDSVNELDKQLNNHLIKSATDEGFCAEENQTFVTSSLGISKPKIIALMGLGDHHLQSVDLFRRFGGETFKIAQKKRAKKISLCIPPKTTIPLFDVVQAITEGFILASYSFDRYHTKSVKENHVKEVVIHLLEKPTPDQKLALKRAENIASSVCYARDLINEGPMELNPQAFAKHAIEVAQSCDLDVSVLDEKKLKKEKMHLMLAVGSAAEPASPPRLIRLHYKPKKNSKRVIVLVGKGVTFDSGGLDIKPADGMLDMKTDMSGAAAVFGTMRAIAKLQPDVEVVGYMGCVENGVGPHAYHPGDIIKSRNGITIEIGNTDAEGRLVLADCLDYAQERDKPDTIIDVATLTGACMIALGPYTAGLFSNNDALGDALRQSGKTVGESFWRLPLLPELKDMLKSPLADMKNVGERWGGSITAALFLEEFIKPGTDWAHLDIAGPASTKKAQSYIPVGGAGFAVRTLVDYIMGQN